MLPCRAPFETVIRLHYHPWDERRIDAVGHVATRGTVDRKESATVPMVVVAAVAY